MTDRELMQQALEALEFIGDAAGNNAIAALRERLAREEYPEAYWLIAPNGNYYKNPKHPMNARQEQEPVAWMDPATGEVCRAHWLANHARERDVDRYSTPLYTAPQREWVGLTEGEVDDIRFGIEADHHTERARKFYSAIEAKLREKNA